MTAPELRLTVAMGDSTREIALDGVGPHHIAPTGDVDAASDAPGVTITRSELAWQVSAGPNGAAYQRLNQLAPVSYTHQTQPTSDLV